MFWLWLALALVAGCALWGIGIERYLFTVREEHLKVLPKNAKPIRVLHISDIHLAPWQRRKQKFVRGLVALKPDLVINTGDNLGSHNAIDSALNMLEPLLSLPGVFVNGSNDYHAPRFRNPLSYLVSASTPTHLYPLDTEKLVAGFEKHSWLNLNNRAGSLTVNGVKLGFLGLDDPHDELADLSSLPSQASGLGATDLTIGVAHAPYLNVLENFAFNGASIAFAGHTHGGQVCLPFKGALVTNCDLPTRAAKGISNWTFGTFPLILNVCAGLGTSIFAPVRFFCRPEVRVVTLLPRD